MRNPRDIVLRACNTSGIEPQKDYFPYKFPLELGMGDKASVNKLAKVLKDGRNGTREMNNALAIFNNWSNRIYLEGLLIYFSIDELSTIQNFSRGTLQTYIDFFFHVDDLKDFDNRMIFIQSIQNEDVRHWFNNCSSREFEDLKTIITGKSRKDSKMRDTMERVFYKVTSIAENFLNIPTDFVQKYQDGIPVEHKFLYEIGLKSSDTSLKIYTALSAQAEDGKDEEEFIKSWESHVKHLEASSFDNELPAEQEETLLALMNEVNPLKAADIPKGPVKED